MAPDKRAMNHDDSVTRLLPSPPDETALHGLYLGHDLRRLAADAGRPLVVANFVASLDGRIATARGDGPGLTVPANIANARDWRLFQELAVQADVVISSGRYLRDYAAGRAQEILRVYDDPRFQDLRDWRTSRGLPPQPDLAVISASLDFPIPAALAGAGRRIVVFTAESADPARRRELERQTGRVIVAGQQEVGGARLLAAMTELGYGVVYSAAGPRVLHLLLADDLLDRLYLTVVGRLLGGAPFASIVEGDLFQSPVDMQLNSVYHDSHNPGQIFLCYERNRRPKALEVKPCVD